MQELSDPQKDHRAYITKEASVRLHKKYEAGALEHGGVLSDHSIEWLIDNAIDEALDQLTYLLTLKEKIGKEFYEL